MSKLPGLREALAKIPDRRDPYQYPLEGVLTLMCLAMMSGCNQVREIARWAQAYRWELPERLGFPREKMPSLGTFQDVLQRVDPEAFERVVSTWADAVLRAHGRDGLEAVAIDGKVVKGSGTEALPAVHLVSALSHELKLVLGQSRVAEETNEIKGVEPLLADLVLEGCVVTVDAQLTQTKIAATIRAKGGTT